MSQNPVWSFRKLQPGPRRDPFEDEFFSGDDEAADAYDRTDFLVREAIQNALDAKRSDSPAPVRVRFAVRTGSSALPGAHAQPFLSGLVEHLQSLKNETLPAGKVPPAMSYVVYEDFGTRGLCGDPMQATDPDPDDPNPQDFYWFWWNVGRSGKGGTDRGRWGLGKTVFPSASRISSQFGLTVRATGAPAKLLMGQAITRIHKLPGGHEYQPEGYFCLPGGDEQIDQPIQDPIHLKQFEQAFELKRGDEPGLSIVIPYCYDAISAVDITRSVILHWFFPILKGELIVEVSGPDKTETLLTATSIRTIADELEWKGSRTERDCLAAADDIARSTGRRAVGLCGDVADAAQVDRLVASVEEALGPVDILVNNAGINIRGAVEELSERDWDAVIDINLKAPFLLARRLGPKMRERGWGRVINLGSILSVIALPGRTPYASAKAGVLNLTRVLALEWAGTGVTANALCPGPFATEMNKPLLEDPVKYQAFVAKIPMGRWGELHEVTGAALFLASEASSFVTGSALFVDGGWTAQ